MRVTLHRDARTKLREAARYYDDRSAGLGIEFVDEFERAIAKVREMPGRYPPAGSGTRWAPIRRFPNKIIYLERPDALRVVAIMHERRSPRYWEARVTKG